MSDSEPRRPAVSEGREHIDSAPGPEMTGAETAGTGMKAWALLLMLVRPYRVRLLVLLLFALIQTAAALAGPWLAGVGIDTGLHWAERGDSLPIFIIGIALASCAVMSALLSRIWIRGVGRVGQQVLFELRRKLFDHIQRLPVSFHDDVSSGQIISRLTSDVATLDELLGNSIINLITAVLNILIIAILMLSLNLELAGITLLSVLPMAAFTTWFSLRSATAYRRTRATIATVIVHFVESLNGIRAVQAFRREARNEEVFRRLAERYRGANRQAQRLETVYWPGLELIFSLTTITVLIVGGIQVIHGRLLIGILVAFLLYVSQFFAPMTSMTGFFSALQSAAAALEKVAAVLATSPRVPEPEDPVVLPEPVRGEVRLSSVSFGYTRGERIIENLNLHVSPGETIALVGATGAGKSTIARLLARFYDPDKGKITLDGTDLRDLSDRQLRRNVVMVTQEGFLFSGSVAENIAFGAPGASRARVEEAAAAVGADSFIRALPDGYETDVRKRGARLSEGQRQLISIARAFLADPSVLILDEATSSLDVPSERIVQRALRSLLRDRTALIIAHRLSTVSIADRVIVLGAGRVIEDGAPDHLISRESGAYAALYRSWENALT